MNNEQLEYRVGMMEVLSFFVIFGFECRMPNVQRNVEILTMGPTSHAQHFCGPWSVDRRQPTKYPFKSVTSIPKPVSHGQRTLPQFYDLQLSHHRFPAFAEE
jgi:hypothetical protein